MIHLLLVISLISITGCGQKPQVRQYTEETVEAPQTQMPAVAQVAQGVDPHAGLDMSGVSTIPTANAAVQGDLAWTVPEGWVQQQGSSMRLATFRAADDPKAIDVSIVALHGMAGGVEANLSRWMGQIQVPATDENVKKIKAQARVVQIPGQLEARVFDLTDLTAAGDAASMIVTAIPVNDKTIFVKMTGSKDDCRRQKDNFLKLVRSLSPNKGDVRQPSPQEGRQLVWKAPSQWKELPGSGFRLVTFRLEGDEQAIDGSIVALEGPAGGLEANLNRWLGQIQLSVSPQALSELIAQAQTVQTAGQAQATIYDFTVLTQGDHTKSMIAAMVPVEGKTIFVKMTGGKNNCQQQKDNFLQLVRSIAAP